MAVSMKVLTVLQFISIFTIYTGLFIAVPALLLHRRLKDEIFSVRFFQCLLRPSRYPFIN